VIIAAATATWSTKLGEPMGGEGETRSVRMANATTPSQMFVAFDFLRQL
jgi:hypothetical protein